MSYYLRVLCPKCSSCIQTELVAERAFENGMEEDKVDVCSNPECDWKSKQYTTSWYVTMVDPEEERCRAENEWIRQ